MFTQRHRTTLSVIATALLVTACGGSGHTKSKTGSARPRPSVVDIYSSLPLVGSDAVAGQSIVAGIRLALQQAKGRAGDFKVHYVSLDDASAAVGQWSPERTARNARRAATDPKAIYYIGEFNSGASKVSMPVLNLAGVAQVSPSNSYVGLTQAITEATSSGEPQKYFPTGTRTYLRIAPADNIQGAADLEALKQANCTKLALANDRTPYGVSLSALIAKEASYYGIKVTSNTGIDPNAPNFRSYAETIKTQGAQCFEFAGMVSNGGVQITKDVNAVLPDATILGPNAMCTSAWTNPRDGGVPSSVAPKLLCTRPTLDLKAYPGGKTFLASYRKAYGDATPDPYAIYGYEAMRLGIETIAHLRSHGDTRSDVVKSLFATTDRRSVIGTYSFNANGDTSLTSYGLYRVAANGDPVFYKTLTPTRYVEGS